MQREMVEKRIERVREKEKSVLYKNAGSQAKVSASSAGEQFGVQKTSSPAFSTPDAVVLSEADSRQIEAQLSPEQLQLFAEENDFMLKHYEDTLGKVQYVFFVLFCFVLEATGGGWNIILTWC